MAASLLALHFCSMWRGGGRELDNDWLMMRDGRIGLVGKSLAGTCQSRWHGQHDEDEKYATNHVLNIKKPL